MVELEFLYSARSLADRLEKQRLFRRLFAWVPMPDDACERASEIQQRLTETGYHRSAGPAGLLISVTAERHRLTVLTVAAVTGQPVRLVADTRPLVAMLNAKDRHREACTVVRGPIIVPAPIVTEIAYFLQIDPAPAVEAAFLDPIGPWRADRRGHHRAGLRPDSRPRAAVRGLPAANGGRLSDRGSRAPGRHPGVQSSGEAMPITSPMSRVWKGRALTVAASTAVDWER